MTHSYIFALSRDFAYAIRSLRHHLGFTSVAVLTLALGIGAATAIFTIVNSVLLRPLPYPGADRIVSLWTRYLPESGYDFAQFQLSGPELEDYRAQTRAFASIAGYVRTGALVTPGDASPDDVVRTEQVIGTANLFDTLGVQAEIGRKFQPGDDRPGADCAVVLSHGLWLDAFGGNPSAIGGTMRVGGPPCTIVGVMPAGFVFPDAQVRLWRNLILDPAGPIWGRLNHNFSAVGRLAPGVTLAQAEAETRTLMTAWLEAYPDHYKGHGVYLRPLLDDVVGGVRSELTMLLAAVGLVLAVICANLASLLLARGEGRRRELGVRLALGGVRGRLVTQLLVESVVLAAAGGALAIAVAVGFVDALLALYPGTLPRADTIAVDWRTFAFAVLAAGASAVLFGLVPALRATSGAPSNALRSGTRGPAGTARGTRLMRGLVVAEVALSVMLVAGAGLLLRSYANLRDVDLGIDAKGVYTVSQALPPAGYPTNPDVRAFYAALLERVRALPGVQSAGAVTNLPLAGGAGAMDDFIIEGRAERGADEPRWNAGFVMATPGYFETLRIPVIAGRSIEPRDVRDAPWVAVINEETARRYWPNEDPIGRRLRYRPVGGSETEPQWITIVGVVANARVNGARAEPEAQIFVPHAQMPREPYSGRFLSFVVRAAGDPAALAPTLNAALREADRSLPLIGGRPFDDVVGDSVGQPRFASQLALFFAVVALVLGALGIHGVLSYVVARRTGELGVRLALGARPDAIRLLVVGDGMRLTALGVAIGLAGAFAAARVFRGLLFGVGPLDPVTLGVAVAVLGAAAFVACYGPAHRAARIDPMTALRAE